MVFQILMIFCLPRYDVNVAFVLLTNSCSFTLLYLFHPCIGTRQVSLSCTTPGFTLWMYATQAEFPWLGAKMPCPN